MNQDRGESFMSGSHVKTWNVDHIPELHDKVIIITGGNAGLGYQSSVEFAKRGATVVIACRDEHKGQHAMSRISAQYPSATVDTIALNLIDFESVKRFSERFLQQYHRLDVLLNNAGVVNLVEREVTSHHHEMHMATNHFGHFALTGRLFPVLTGTPHSRVVTVSSWAWKAGTIDFGDLNWARRPYHRFKAYGDSKLANLLFMLHLQKKFESAEASSLSAAAHPGLSSTARQQSSYIQV
jgi:NAD(P)-dependent dehydrogenase (short-subunit alcohol dehydrogenase family)